MAGGVERVAVFDRQLAVGVRLQNAESLGAAARVGAVDQIRFKTVDRDGCRQPRGFLAPAFIKRPVKITHTGEGPCCVRMADQKNAQGWVRCRAHFLNVAICAVASIHQKDKVHCNINSFVRMACCKRRVRELVLAVLVSNNSSLSQENRLFSIY